MPNFLYTYLKCLVRCLRALSIPVRSHSTMAKRARRVHWHSSLVGHVEKTASQFDFTEDRVPSTPPCRTSVASPLAERTRFASCTLWDLHFRHLRDAYIGCALRIMKFAMSFFSLSYFIPSFVNRSEKNSPLVAWCNNASRTIHKQIDRSIRWVARCTMRVHPPRCSIRIPRIPKYNKFTRLPRYRVQGEMFCVRWDAK